MPPNWSRRLPAHVINGITAAVGIGLIQLLFSASAGSHAARLAVSGAICASLADLPNVLDRAWRNVLAAALASSIAALTVDLLRTFPLTLGLAISAITFLAMLMMVWGPRAGPISFAAVLSVVFSLAIPPSQPLTPQLFVWTVSGAFAYLAWAVATTAGLQSRYRTLALAATLATTARLFRLRADAQQGALRQEDQISSLRKLINNEAELAERLQFARNLLFSAPDTPQSRRETAMLLRTIDLRDVLLASRLDLDRLGNDRIADLVREAVAISLREIADALDVAQTELRSGTIQHDGLEASLAGCSLLASASVPADDPRSRLLPALVDRLTHLADDVTEIHALLRGRQAELPLSPSELQLFVESKLWPLTALRSHLSMRSPVFRHALRTAMALGSAYFIERSLPWVSHPHWLILSVAVVLRGNLEQTLSRRNARVFGTALGCLMVLLLSRVESLPLLSLAFLLAIGVAHSFVTVRYLVTASAATVMALLQTHFVDPTAGFPIAERLVDTLLGALIAWGFSYVLPSWERRALPSAIDRALLALQAYAGQALLRSSRTTVPQLIARRRAYGCLDVVATALQRSAVEPHHVRLPVRELLTLIENANRLVAHLSGIRLMLARRLPELDRPEVTTALRTADMQLHASLAAPHSPASDNGESDAADLQLLPAEPPTRNLLPWLLRRLRVAVQDARRVARDAKAVQDLLASGEGKSPGDSDGR